MKFQERTANTSAGLITFQQNFYSLREGQTFPFRFKVVSKWTLFTSLENNQGLQGYSEQRAEILTQYRYHL